MSIPTRQRHQRCDKHIAGWGTRVTMRDKAVRSHAQKCGGDRIIACGWRRCKTVDSLRKPLLSTKPKPTPLGVGWYHKQVAASGRSVNVPKPKDLGLLRIHQTIGVVWRSLSPRLVLCSCFSFHQGW